MIFAHSATVCGMPVQDKFRAIAIAWMVHDVVSSLGDFCQRIYQLACSFAQLHVAMTVILLALIGFRVDRRNAGVAATFGHKGESGIMGEYKIRPYVRGSVGANPSVRP